MFTQDFFYLNLCSLLSVLSLGITEKIRDLSSLHTPIRYLYIWSLLWSWLNSPSSLSLSSHKRCSSPRNNSVALQWTCSGMLMSVLCRGAQNWTLQDVQMQCYMCWGEGKDQLTSLDLLVMLFLIQPRMPFTFFAMKARCWLMANLLSTRTPGSFLQSCFPAGHSPACTGSSGCFFPCTRLQFSRSPRKKLLKALSHRSNGNNQRIAHSILVSFNFALFL